MKFLRTARVLLAPLGVVAVAALIHGARPASAPTRALLDEPLLVPFIVPEVRVPGAVDAQVLFYNPGGPSDPGGESVELVELRLLADGLELDRTALAGDVVGSREYGEIQVLIERLPEELSHLAHPRYFAAADAPTFEGVDARNAYRDIGTRVEALKQAYAAGQAPPFRSIDFVVHFDQVFAPDTAPGTRAELALEIDYRTASGALATARTSQVVELLRPRLALPAPLVLAGFAAAAGDLHVHSCHGEAVNACAPSGNCGAETLQTSGSFSYAQLKSQFQALGLDWITATDHSYCIDSPAEYDAVVAECAALNDPGFLLIPDIELSSDEVGAQTGGDTGDLACIFSGGANHNHMGAHGISSWKQGGSQGFLGFCGGGALSNFTDNVAAIRAEGGYAITHHPTAGSFAWNSYAATFGIEAGALHGVEIWNGASVSGQGGDVGRWVDWLLDGRLMYAYSGSDTHDQAFAFGSNNVLLSGALTIPNVESALRHGRHYISRDHVLVLEAAYDGLTLSMGSLQSLPPTQPASALALDVHYNFGVDSGTITVFRGRVGENSEVQLCQSGTLTGEGTFTCNETLDTNTRTYYRAYSSAGGQASYTNPVFFLPNACSWATYAVGAGGANTGSLTSDQAPAIGTLNRLDVAGFSNNAPVTFLSASNVKFDPPIPLFGGFLAIGAPALFDIQLPLSGGGGALPLALPLDSTLVGATLYWQAIAIDFDQPQLLAFSNGLEMPLCNFGQ